MNSVLSASSTISIIKEFQVSLFWKFVKGEPMRTGDIAGRMEITIDLTVAGGDPVVTDLWVAADNGRMGAQARGDLINLNAADDERLYLLVLDAIDHQYQTRIEEWAQDEACHARYEYAA